ncbi:hypothetical protein HPB52_005753 [Rhipicephalus sanguineus]|uniref:Uncharacterized protein n=1 Tax=Rhipicephalus sanguineus TaxID=34632 RepID=A0A9D4SWG0_RHISA|nr:hypothetical protein HPB52_005753 [Rhipicephalus sanguineus]
MVHGIDFTTPWGSIRKANKKGMPLLTTGMCKAIQEQNLTEEAFRAKLNAVTTRISEWVNSGDDAGMNKVTMNAEVEFIKDCGAQAIDLQNDTAGNFQNPEDENDMEEILKLLDSSDIEFSSDDDDELADTCFARTEARAWGEGKVSEAEREDTRNTGAENPT